MKANRYMEDKYAIDGSNARRLHQKAAPNSYEESMSEWLDRREQTQRQKRGNEAKKRRLQKEWETRMGLSTFLVLTVAVVCTFYVCISYLNVQSEVTNSSKKIASIESEIISIKNSNQIAREKASSTIDLAEVYKIATKELGMVHPSQNQIIEYDKVKSDYLKQYSEIPEVKKENLITKIINSLKNNLG